MISVLKNNGKHLSTSKKLNVVLHSFKVDDKWFLRMNPNDDVLSWKKRLNIIRCENIYCEDKSPYVRLLCLENKNESF
jgi:hypothetical protein